MMDISIRITSVLLITSVNIISNFKLLASSLHSSCNEECQVAPHVRCSVIQDAVCGSDSYNSSNGGSWPSAPVNFNVAVTTDINPRVNVSWHMPGDASFLNVTGFLLEITQLPTNESNCIHIDLTGTSWEVSDRSLMLHFTCFSGLTIGHLYYMTVQSLPLPYPSHSHKTKDLFVAFIPVGNGTTSMWLSVIKFHVLPSDEFSEIRIYFKPAPPKFGFTGYDVAILDNTNNNVEMQTIFVDRSTEEEVSLKNVCAGKHKIVITPHPESRYNGSCTCGGSKENCLACPAAVTELFSLTSGNPCKTLVSTVSSSVPELPRHDSGSFSSPSTTLTAVGDIDNSTVIASVVAGALSVLVVIVVVLFVVVCKKLARKSPKPVTHNLYEEQSSTFDGKNVVWRDFFTPPRPPQEFADAGTLDMQRINDDQSQMIQNDSGYAEMQSLQEESGSV